MSLFDNKTILVTGGTGSFGQAIVIELLKTGIRAIRVLSRNEYLQVMMQHNISDGRVHYKIGDVRDRERLELVMRGCDFVIHAAALKHITSGESNPQEVVKTNILGSTNVLEVASLCRVSKVLGISSDKAVNPVSLYGATKLVMERMFIEANRWSWPDTAFACMRSGNFFESSGNVFEVWDKQAKTGTITLTDEGMYRYFIDIQDAAKFALNCLAMMVGGEIFVPQMTEYSMSQLAKTLHPDCKIEVIGVRNGERLHEPLFSALEKPEPCEGGFVLDTLKDVLI